MNLRSIFLAGLVSLAFSLPLAATADPAPAPPGAGAAQITAPALQPCPPRADRLDVAETSQADCCKGHKGVCGCRAGKIVCCDGTASPNCTCHGDDGLLQ